MALMIACAGAYTATSSVPSIRLAGLDVNDQPVAGTFGAGNESVDPLGITNDRGFELSWMTHGARIDKSDDYSKTLLDGIMQGAEWRLRFQCLEYPIRRVDAAGGVIATDINTPMTIAWPWGKAGFRTPVPGFDPAGPLAPYLPFVGQRWSDLASALVLTALAGTPASRNPATLSAPFTIASPDTQNALLFTTKLRVVTIDSLLLPYAITQPHQYPSLSGKNVITWFVTT